MTIYLFWINHKMAGGKQWILKETIESGVLVANRKVAYTRYGTLMEKYGKENVMMVELNIPSPDSPKKEALNMYSLYSGIFSRGSLACDGDPENSRFVIEYDDGSVETIFEGSKFDKDKYNENMEKECKDTILHEKFRNIE